jgi:hypothetical protein
VRRLAVRLPTGKSAIRQTGKSALPVAATRSAGILACRIAGLSSLRDPKFDVRTQRTPADWKVGDTADFPVRLENLRYNDGNNFPCLASPAGCTKLRS